MMMRIKRPVTLLELLISLSLTAVLLSAMLGYYRQAYSAKSTVKRRQGENFELLYLEYRLNKIIPTILNPSGGEKSGTVFYTRPPSSPKEKSDSLIFSYDNGPGSGTLFSKEVLGKLFVDHQNQLILLTWPAAPRYFDPDPPMRQEILLTRAQNLEFAFYKPVPKEKKGLEIDPETKTGHYDIWTGYWPLEDKELPALIKIKVHIIDKEEPVEYAFVLSNCHEHIYYQ